jgi:acyl-CoA thioester hydrolase
MRKAPDDRTSSSGQGQRQGQGEGEAEGKPQAQGHAHILPVRVYYEDTDFSGFCYHGSYVRFFERGRTELLRMAKVAQSDLHEADGFAFVVRRMCLDYLKPARMDDELVIETRVRDMRGATMILDQAVLRGGEILVTAEVTVAATKKGRAVRIPDGLRLAMIA